MAFIFGNLSPKNHPLFWDGMKYYYNAGVNASSINTTKLHDFSDFLMNNTIMVNTPTMSTQLMTRANNLFDGDTNLEIVTSPLYVTNCTTFSNAFRNCSKLKNVRLEGSLKANLDMHWCSLLTIESVLSICFAMMQGANRQLNLSYALNSYANEYVKINVTGDGLEVTTSTDPDALGTLGQYVTGKGWTMVFV